MIPPGPTDFDHWCARHFAADADGFVQIKGIVNPATGVVEPVDLITHLDDLDWCVNAWQEIFWMDWQLQQAARGQ